MAKPRKLSLQQRERIRLIQDKRRQRLADRASRSASTVGQLEGEPVEGQVIVRNGKHFVVADSAGELHLCLSRTNLGHIVCGDRVVWHMPSSRTSENGIIVALLPRTSVLARPDFSGRDKPLAANIDRLIILIAPEPEPAGYLIDQYLITAETIGVSATIAINKIDLLDQQDREDFVGRFAHYQQIGYPLISISAKLERGLEPIVESLRGGTGILVGQSGVGKSSLINALLPNRDVQVGRLSEATGLGKHTTSTATRYTLPHGGHLIDSPGVRSFRLTALGREGLERGFVEFADYLGKCRFADCGHDQEPDCALKDAVRKGAVHAVRLANFVHMVKGENRTR